MRPLAGDNGCERLDVSLIELDSAERRGRLDSGACSTSIRMRPALRTGTDQNSRDRGVNWVLECALVKTGLCLLYLRWV